jgi:hypothetical protein
MIYGKNKAEAHVNRGEKKEEKKKRTGTGSG